MAGRIHQTLPCIDKVLCPDRLAVRPLCTLAQSKSPSESVFTYRIITASGLFNFVAVKSEKPKVLQERPREKKLKFSYKEEREFATIEDDIAALEEAIAQVETEMSAAGSDYVKLQELTEKQTKLSAELEEKMDRWMYLTDLAERIAAQE